MENVQRGATQVEPGEGKTLLVLGDLYRFVVASEETNGAFAVFETTATPGLPGPPPHIHHREDEAVYVLEGEFELYVEGNTTTVGPGVFVSIPKGTLHTWSNAGNAPARILAMVTPGGFEDFFEEVGEPVEAPYCPPAGPPDVEKVLAAAPRYGLEILSPREG
ncbi:MAG: quercetin 2,3-dioxygenase [Actinomycetota bacterium]|nr:quercetin 2,3-dioxygenase [Actinomycetota bacterium]